MVSAKHKQFVGPMYTNILSSIQKGSGSVVVCLLWDQKVEGLNLTGITVLCS